MKPELGHTLPARREVAPRLDGASWKLGRLEVVGAGDDPIARCIAGEMGDQPRPTGTEHGRLSIRFVKPERTVNEVRVGPSQNRAYFISPDRIRVEDPMLSVTFNLAFDKVTLASKAGEWPHRTDSLLTRLREESYQPALVRAGKQFLYDSFNQLVQLRQLSMGQTWIHSSAVTKGERTVALMAWGGTGKTSTMLQLVRHDGWRFLADDLTVIDESGHVYRAPHRLQMSALNVEGDACLRKRVLAGRGPLDRFQWYERKWRRGAGRVRRRMHASELFGGDAIADEGQLTDAFFLRRVNRPSFNSRDISPEHAAALSSQVLHAELDPLCEMQTAIFSSAVPVELPGLQTIHNEAERILTSAFSSLRARCRLIDVPFGAGPSDLGSYFSRILED